MEDLQARQAARRAAPRGGPRRDERSIAERLRAWQRKALFSVPLALFLFILNAATQGFPWFIFAWMGIFGPVIGRAVGLWQDGLRFTDFFRRPSLLEGLEASPAVARGTKRPALQAPPADARAEALVGREVLQGPHGGVVRRAAEDEAAVLEILGTLSGPDRSQLPDVASTVRGLVERVASLAQSLDRLDRDLRPEQITQLERRLAEARALPDGSDRLRRVQLLERQATTLAELSQRRDALAGQLDSAALVLQTMRLDLLRLRSAGIGVAAAGINTVTQEARALSLDIERVVGAAAEVRKL